MPLIYTRHDPRHFDRRLYKGGDGGAGQMRADEEARQRKVQQAIDAINVMFGAGGPAAPMTGAQTSAAIPQTGTVGRLVARVRGQVADAAYPGAMDEYGRQQQAVSGNKTAREALYTDISGAVKDTAMRDVDRQYGKASKENLFGLANSGLLGGSVDAESGGELQTLYGEGKLKAAQAGQAAASDLRATDEKTRQNLISLAQSGLDVGTASSLAAGQMGAAAEVAKANANGATVGSLFDNMGQAYLANQVLKARQGVGVAGTPQAYGYGAATALQPGRGHVFKNV